MSIIIIVGIHFARKKNKKLSFQSEVELESQNKGGKRKLEIDAIGFN